MLLMLPKMPHDEADAKALDVITRGGPLGVSALAIGRAVTKGERRDHHIARDDKEALGLTIAMSLVERGHVAVTRGNRFVLKWYAQHGKA